MPGSSPNTESSPQERAAHQPVLLREVLEQLDIKEGGVYVDATVGLGGHAEALLQHLSDGGMLIGIDRDLRALDRSRQRLADNRVRLHHSPFSEMDRVLGSIDISSVDGILLDLGVSMMQLKDADRGFSFTSAARLDMRMDTTKELTAWDLVNRAGEQELETMIREYGEEFRARKIVRRISEARKKTSIDTCSDLAMLVEKAIGRHGKTHPATRTFQALRIAVNGELEELRKGLVGAVGLLKQGGRLCVISYHSLEDRIVKNTFRDLARAEVVRPLTKKPVAPERDELRKNPSSRSAKLRGVEKL